jgi:mono/diheme cytochrome c family protein
MVKVMRFILGLALGLLPLTAAAQDLEIGRAMAERWCMSCHVVERTQDVGAANGIPTFSAIAAKPTTTVASLRAVLSQPHGRMPDFSLGRREQDALISYILSLR